MAEGKLQAVTNMSTRQKLTIAAFVIIILVIIWQVAGLFGGDTPSATPPAPTTTTTTTTTMSGGAMRATGPGGAMGNAPSPMQQQPQNAQLFKQEPMTQREIELMKLQQETQAKYLSALNELQLLKVSKDIAETNQAIAKAKLATIAAEKNIVNLLSPPAPPQITPAGYASGLINPVTSGTPVAPAAPAQQSDQQQAPQPPATTTTTTTTTIQPSYTVVSVSQLQFRWNAVLGYQGNLYNVSIGDVLPADGSKVIAIDKSGVWLEKDSKKKKISLIPII